MTKFIVIASAKGGAGKTTTAINLAALFGAMGKNITLIDADLTAPNISAYLGLPDVPVTLHDVLRGKNRTSEAIYLHPSGFKIMPAGASMLNEDFKKPFSSVALDIVGKTELAIIDSSATLGRETLDALRSADETIVVANPEMPSVLDAKRTIEAAEDSGSIIPGIVVNRARNGKNEISISEIKSMLQKPVIGIIPEDKSMRLSLLMKQPIVHTHPNSPASKGFKELANMLK